MALMRAALYDRYGDPGVIYHGRLPVPVPGENDVLLRVEASSVNAGDLLLRSGRLRAVTGRRFPRQLGIDVVGKIVHVGSRVRGFGPDMRVWGVLGRGARTGTAADYVVMPAHRLSIAPEGLSAVGAVSLLAGGTTALTGLRSRIRLQSGERLLVRGAGGGVGTLAVQIGVHRQARVTALASADQTDALEDLGAEAVLDYRTTAVDELGEYDVIFDTRGSEVRAFRQRLSSNGRMVSIAFDTSRPLRTMSQLAFSALYGSQRIRFFSGNPKSPLLDELRHLAASGAIRPVVDSIYPLPRVDEAHAALEAGGVFGKIAIDHTQ